MGSDLLLQAGTILGLLLEIDVGEEGSIQMPLCFESKVMGKTAALVSIGLEVLLVQACHLMRKGMISVILQFVFASQPTVLARTYRLSSVCNNISVQLGRIAESEKLPISSIPGSA